MKKLFLIVAVLGATLSLFSQNSEIKMDPAIRYGVLDNGLTYYIRHNDVVPERADFYIVQNDISLTVKKTKKDQIFQEMHMHCQKML